MVITKDEDAMTILLDFGLIEKLVDPQRHGTKMSFSIYDAYPTHWVLAVRLGGYQRPEDNGYLVAAWPKSLFGRSVYEDALRKMGHDPMTAQYMGLGDQLS